MKTACAQNKAWQMQGHTHIRVAVNLSARQFSAPDLVQTIIDVLQETGLAPECLDVEITESLIMTDVERAVSVLHKLKEHGVQLSIDDFGTGLLEPDVLEAFSNRHPEDRQVIRSGHYGG